MNQIDCNVIKDLLPLYVDDAASPETKTLIEAHAAECPACLAEMETMKKNIPMPICSDGERAKAEFIKAIAKQLKRKRVRTAIISALTAAFLIVGTYVVMVIPSRVIPYEEGLVSVRDDGGDVWVHFTGKSYNGFYMREIIELEIDGEKKNAMAIYYEETLYSKYLEPLLHKDHTFDDEFLLNDPYYTENDNGEMERIEQALDVIYYSTVKMNVREEDPQSDWTEHMDDMVLIWERDTP